MKNSSLVAKGYFPLLVTSKLFDVARRRKSFPIQKEVLHMKIYSETSLASFEFWSGAKVTRKYLTVEEMDQIETILEEQYPDGMNEIELNDFFWFEDNTIAEWLGYSSFEEITNREDED